MVVIFDGNHLANRCYFSSVHKGSLFTSYGKDVGTIYFTINTFNSYIKRFAGNKLVVTWDSQGKSQRHEIFPEYKAGRDKRPQEFYDQINDIIEIFDAMGIAQFRIPTVEADDIVGTLMKQARKQGKKVIIFSSDHDFEQLISNSVTIISPIPGNELIKDKNYVLEKYSMSPNDVTDILSLMGDETDSIDGIPSVAEVTASKLLKANDGLDNIIKNIEQLKTLNKRGEVVDATDKLKENIKQYWHLVERNRKLVKINCDLEQVDINKKTTRDFNKLLSLFEKFEFNRFVDSFDKIKSSIISIEE